MRKSIILMLTYINLTLLLSFSATPLIAQTDFWEPINTGLTDTGVFAFTINSGGDIFAGTVGSGVFRSSDNGDNWNAINTGLTFPGTIVTPGVFALTINSSGDIFAGSSGAGVFRSSDNGDTWSQTGLSSVESFAINSSGEIFAGGLGGVFRSSDNGDNWNEINTGLTLTFVFALAINTGGEIFAGGLGGVFRSSDNGDNWSPINTGLMNTDVFAFAFNSSGEIFAGTSGGGVFRSVEPTTSVEQISTTIPPSFALEQNYPNPFNPTTTIQFTLAKGANVKLKVFSIEGKEVATLVDEAVTPGVHTFRFEANGLPSGVYFYRIEAGELFQTKRLMLLK